MGLAATALVLAALVLARPGAAVPELARLPPGDLAILGYVGIVGTGGAYLAFVLGMHLSRSAAAGLTATLIEPGVAAVLAALVLPEPAPDAAAGRRMRAAFAAMVLLFLAERRHAVQ